MSVERTEGQGVQARPDDVTPQVRRSLQAKFLAINIPFAVISTFILFALFEFHVYEQAIRQLGLELESLLQLERKIVARSLWNLDVPEAEAVLSAVVHDKDVAAAAIYDESGQLFASAGSLNSSDPELTGRTSIEFSTDVSSPSIGVLQIDMTDEPLREAQAERLGFAASAALIIALSGVFGALIANRRTTGIPLQRLLRAILESRDGVVHRLVEWESDDEMGQVIAAFNQMQSRYTAYENSLVEAREQLALQRDSLEDQVAERTQRLIDAQAELVRKERLAVLGQLTGTIAHELRNPLGTLRNSVTLIEDLGKIDQPPPQDVIDIVVRSIDRSDRIISDLLDFSRVRELYAELVNMDQWLQVVIDEYVLADGITLERQFGAGVSVKIDTERMRQVLVILLDNACQALQGDNSNTSGVGGGVVTVQTRVSSSRLEIAVSDTGPGIDEVTAKKIFDPLFSTKTFGVGLGLVHARQTMALHDGGLELDFTEPGAGARFVAWLPESVIE